MAQYLHVQYSGLDFSERAEVFVKDWLYNVLGAECYWFRFEYAAIRGAIDCHCLAKLKNDPVLYNLVSKAVLAKEIREELMDGYDTNVR